MGSKPSPPHGRFVSTAGRGIPTARDLIREAKARAATDAAASIVPTEGPVRIFLDDERPPPEGWVLCRDGEAFDAAMETVEPCRIEAIAFDWHLGGDVENGEAVLERFLARLVPDVRSFSILEIVHFHSSDHDAAMRMMRRSVEVLKEADVPFPDFCLDVGEAWDRTDPPRAKADQ